METNLEPLKIRRASALDLDAVVAANLAMALETEGKVLDRETLRSGVESVLGNAGLGFYLVAEREGQVVGQLLITTEWSDWRNAYFWWIQSVYVIPERRRQGVYRALYDQVILEAKQAGNVCGVRLYVDQENLIAQRTYEHLGMAHSHYRLYEVEF